MTTFIDRLLLRLDAHPAIRARVAPTRMAEARWRARNEATRARGCRCGKPATICLTADQNVGSVPVEFWTCADHVGVNVWLQHMDGTCQPADEIQARYLQDGTG
jgi:hypothetical protein